MEDRTDKRRRAPRGTPTVSYAATDGVFVELLFDPDSRATSLAASAPGEPVQRVPHFDLSSGERLVPYSATNPLIRSRTVLLPSHPEEPGTKAELLAAIRDYLDRYVDLSPTFREVAAHYVLLSWVHDAFNELPYLRLRGDYGTGKTRALLAIGSICYKPLIASGATTASPIFHMLDAFGATLVLDEADLRFSDATADLTKILNNGNVRGVPVLRTMQTRAGELSPQAFQVFGPKLLAMREHFDDKALESRFLTEETGRRPLPPHIPLHLPSFLQEEALRLRNRLLSWRFRTRPIAGIHATRAIAGVEARVNQMALPLLSVVDDPDIRAEIAQWLIGEDAARRAERTETEEAVILASLAQCFAREPGRAVRVADIAAGAVAQLVSGEIAVPNPKRTGWVLRQRLRLQTRKSNGIYVVPPEEREKLGGLAARYGISLYPELENGAAGHQSEPPAEATSA